MIQIKILKTNFLRKLNQSQNLKVHIDEIYDTVEVMEALPKLESN